MTDFACGQRNDAWSRRGHWSGRWHGKRTALVHTDAHQESRGQHDESDIYLMQPGITLVPLILMKLLRDM